MLECSLQMILITVMVTSTPLILASLGGIISEKSGICNIALEGTMLVSIVAYALIAESTGSILLALSGSILGGVLYSLLLWLFTQKYCFDHIISGVILNTLAIGLCPLLYSYFSSPEALHISPVLDTRWFVLISICLTFVTHIFLEKSYIGLHLKAVGNHPDIARHEGIEPVQIRFISMILAGIYCSLAGCAIFSNVGMYTENVTCARGFLALVTMILGGWKPVSAMFWSIFIGFFMVVDLVFQGSSIFGYKISAYLWNSLPYIVVLVSLSFIKSKHVGPSGVGRK